MLSAESFQTSSLRSLPEGQSITRILAASIQAVEPGAAVERFVHREGDILTVSDRVYNLAIVSACGLAGDWQSFGCDECSSWPGSLEHAWRLD